MSDKYDKTTKMFLREIYYTVYLSNEELSNRLQKFTDKINNIIKNNSKDIDINELKALNKNIKFTEVVNEIKLMALTLQKNIDLNNEQDIKRFKAKLLVISEEKILDLIEFYAPNIANIIRDKLGINFKTV